MLEKLKRLLKLDMDKPLTESKTIIGVVTLLLSIVGYVTGIDIPLEFLADGSITLAEVLGVLSVIAVVVGLRGALGRVVNLAKEIIDFLKQVIEFIESQKKED